MPVAILLTAAVVLVLGSFLLGASIRPLDPSQVEASAPAMDLRVISGVISGLLLGAGLGLLGTGVWQLRGAVR